MSDLRELAERLLKRVHSPGAVVLVESWPEIQRLAYGVLSLLTRLEAAEAALAEAVEALERIKTLLDPPTATRAMPTEWAITQVRGIVQTALRARYRYRAAHGEEGKGP